MVRITVQNEDQNSLVIQIEGRFVDPCIAEFDSTWTMLSLGSKKLCVDISGVTFMDESGKRRLGLLMMATNGVIRAKTPLTRDFADEINRIQLDIQEAK